jgi:hypothetical protein
MSDEQFAPYLVRNTCTSASFRGGCEQYMPHHTADAAPGLNAAHDARPCLPTSCAPPCALHLAPSPDNFSNPQLYTSRPTDQPVERFDSAPATWSAWISEERRRSDCVDAPLFSHTMPPHFLDPKMAEIDDLASRLPHGLLGGMLDADTSDATSRSTCSRRARLGTEGSAPTMPGMDLFRHEESQNLSRRALHLYNHPLRFLCVCLLRGVHMVHTPNVALALHTSHYPVLFRSVVEMLHIPC